MSGKVFRFIVPRVASRSGPNLRMRFAAALLMALVSLAAPLGAAKRVPPTRLDVRRCDGLRTLEERFRILRRLSSDFRRQPKVALGLRDVNIRIWKDALSVLSGKAADVIRAMNWWLRRWPPLFKTSTAGRNTLTR
jgi:hypothetical protein